MNTLALIVFVLAIRSDYYETKKVAVRAAQADLWTPTNNAGRVALPLDAGWLEYVEIANTNTVWKLYVVTGQQTLNRVTAAKITQWQTAIGTSANLKLAKMQAEDVAAWATTNGLKPRIESKIPGVTP